MWTDGIVGCDLDLILYQIWVRQNDPEFLLKFEDVHPKGIEPLLFILVCWVEISVFLRVD